jgi:Tfp pilus assembly protein PilN
MKPPNELSFLPDDYLENKAQRRANVICAFLFLVVMVSIGFAFTTSEKSLRTVESEHNKVEKDFTDAAKRIQQVQELQEKQRTMARQAELTASLLEKVPRSLILARITNALPQGVSLTDFILESKKRASTKVAADAPKTAFEVKKAKQAAKETPVGQVAEAKVYDVSMKISGLAPTDRQVGDFINKLKGVELFKEVNLIISDWEKPDTGDGKKDKNADQFRRFQIELTLDPNADAKADTKTSTASTDNK